MGAGASTLIPAEYADLSSEKQAEFKEKFSVLTSKVLPAERDSAESEAISSIHKEYIYDIINKGESVTIDLPILEIALNEVRRNGTKTPLIVDNSENDAVNTFYSYRSAILLDGKKMGLDKTMKHVPVPEIMEEARKKLVQAIKMGCPLVIAMTKSVTDFATTFCDEAASVATENPLNLEDGTKMFFPLKVFQNSGKELLADDIMSKLFRDDEKEQGFATSRDPEGFQVILTTQFSPEDFEGYLFGEAWGLPKPKTQFQFIIINSTPRPPISSLTLTGHDAAEGIQKSELDVNEGVGKIDDASVEAQTEAQTDSEKIDKEMQKSNKAGVVERSGRVGGKEKMQKKKQSIHEPTAHSEKVATGKPNPYGSKPKQPQRKESKKKLTHSASASASS